MKYKFIEDLTSDVLFEAYGKDLKELFENAAEAMFSIICKLDKVKPKNKEKIEMKAEKLEDLMINWLQGLIAMVDTEEMFYSKFKVLEIDDNHVIAEISGESTSPEKGNTVVKAVTYYKYKLEKDKKGYKVTVSLDI
jgi:SHS2 domain-containing protein